MELAMRYSDRGCITHSRVYDAASATRKMKGRKKSFFFLKKGRKRQEKKKVRKKEK